MIQKLERVRGPVCGVFASAMATNKSFNEVFSHAKALHGRTGNWKGRMSIGALVKLLASLDINFVLQGGFYGDTLRKTVEKLNPRHHHIVWVTGHFLTVHDGMCYDQSHPEGVSISEYCGARKKVKRVYRID